MKGVDTESCARESRIFVVSVDKDINIANAVACALAIRPLYIILMDTHSLLWVQ